MSINYQLQFNIQASIIKVAKPRQGLPYTTWHRRTPTTPRATSTTRPRITAYPRNPSLQPRTPTIIRTPMAPGTPMASRTPMTTRNPIIHRNPRRDPIHHRRLKVIYSNPFYDLRHFINNQRRARGVAITKNRRRPHHPTPPRMRSIHPLLRTDFKTTRTHPTRISPYFLYVLCLH